MTRKPLSEAPVVWGCVIAAAGASRRFGGSLPKQLSPLAGRRVLDWSLDTALSIERLSRVVLVLPGDLPGAGEEWQALAPGRVLVAPGGQRRQDSVRAGLALLRDCTHVLVHDGARPLASRRLWLRVMEAGEAHGAAIPAMPVTDTVKRAASGRIEGTLDRSGLWLAQTPQGFEMEMLMKALDSAEGALTDESAALEALGRSVFMLEGETGNVKITTRDDLELASALLGSGTPRERSSGIGLDAHPFEEGRPLIVGGCLFEGETGLAGHSDGDVLLHAIVDALLSACRLGDTGVLYPPDQARWKDADSAELLSGALRLAESEGWRLDRVDATLVGVRPLVARHRDRLIQRLCSICSLHPSRVWVKGTSGNGMGFAGRGEGLMALVLAEVSRPAAHGGGESGSSSGSSRR